MVESVPVTVSNTSEQTVFMQPPTKPPVRSDPCQPIGARGSLQVSLPGGCAPMVTLGASATTADRPASGITKAEGSAISRPFRRLGPAPGDHQCG